MPFIRVLMHYVWSTKNREPILVNEFRYPLFDHIRQNANNKKIYLDRINGYYDHVHCIISLGSNQTIEKVAQLIKGNLPSGSIISPALTQRSNGKMNILQFL